MTKILLRIVFAAALTYLAPATAEEFAAPPALQTEFNVFIAQFRAALKLDDSAAVAGMAQLPFMNDTAVSSTAQFRERIYKVDFTMKNRTCIQHGKVIFDRDQQGNESFLIFCGQLIFGFAKMPASFLLTEIGMND